MAAFNPCKVSKGLTDQTEAMARLVKQIVSNGKIGAATLDPTTSNIATLGTMIVNITRLGSMTKNIMTLGTITIKITTLGTTTLRITTL